MWKTAGATLTVWVLLTAATTHVHAADCDITALPESGASYSSGRLTCTTSEDVAVGNSPCYFEVEGDHTDLILEENSGTVPIEDYFTFQNSLDGLSTKITVMVTNSIDDFADKTTAIFGHFTCGSVSTTFLMDVNYINDHQPQFSPPSYSINGLPENFPPAVELSNVYGFTIQAFDNDTIGDPTSALDFSVTEEYADLFNVKGNYDSDANEYQVQLYVTTTLDYATNPNYNVIIQATDRGTPKLTGTATVQIQVADADNLDPAFDYIFYAAEVTEDMISAGVPQPLSTTPGPIHAFDQDTGIDTPVTYTIELDQNDDDYDAVGNAFSVDPSSGVITFNAAADISTITDYLATFAIKATQVDDAEHYGLTFVKVNLPQPEITTLATTTGTPCPTFEPTTPCVCPTDTTVVYTTAECPTFDTSTACPTQEPVTCPTQEPTTPCYCPTDTTITTDVTTACPTVEPVTCPTVEPVTCPTSTTDITTACPTQEPVTCSTQEPVTCPTQEPVTCPTQEPVTCPTQETTTTCDCPTDTTTACPTDATTACPPVTDVTCPTEPTTIYITSTACPTDQTDGDQTSQSATYTTTAGTTITFNTDSSSGSGTTPTAFTCTPTDATGTTPTTTTTKSTTTTEPTTTTTTRKPTSKPTPPTPNTNEPTLPSMPPPTGQLIPLIKVDLFTQVGVIVVNMANGVSQQLAFSLSENDYFAINPTSGEIYVASELTKTAQIDLEVEAMDSDGTLVDSSWLSFWVLDEGITPSFAYSYNSETIKEGNSYEKTEVINLESRYESLNEDNTFYNLDGCIPSSGSDIFSVDDTGLVTLNGDLDFETVTQYLLTIRSGFKDGYKRIGLSSQIVGEDVMVDFTQTLISVNVGDWNDELPKFSDSAITIGTASFISYGQDILQLQTTDKDADPINRITYYSIDSNSDFYVDSNSGIMRSNVDIAKLEPSPNPFKVTAYASNNPDGTDSTQHISIYILSDDQVLVLTTLTLNSEDFDESVNTIISKINTATGMDIRFPKWEASDIDDQTTVLMYVFNDGVPLSGDDLMKVVVDFSTAFDDYFDTSDVSLYTEPNNCDTSTTTTKATTPTTSLTTTEMTTTTTRRTTSKPTPPTPGTNEPTLPSMPPPTDLLPLIKVDLFTQVGAIVVNMANGVTQQLAFSLSENDHFAINPTSGEIYVASELTKTAQIDLEVEAMDSDGTLVDFSRLSFWVLDEGITPSFAYSYNSETIKEGNSFEKTEVINLESRYESLNQDNTFYTLDGCIPSSGSDIFSVDDTGLVTLNGDLDFETVTQYLLIIRSGFKDGYKRNVRSSQIVGEDVMVDISQTMISVNVGDWNDELPVFSSTSLLMGTAFFISNNGQDILQLQTTDRDAEASNRVTYYSMSASTDFYVDADSGLLRPITDIQNLESHDGPIKFTVYASNKPGEQDSHQDITIYILQQSQVLVMNNTAYKDADEFDQQYDSIISNLCNITKKDVRIPKWETVGDGKTRLYMYVFDVEVSELLGDSTAAPLDQDDLKRMIDDNKDQLESYNFEVDTALTYNEMTNSSNPIQPTTGGSDDDNTGYIAGISVLAVLLVICLAVGGFFGYKYYRRSKKTGAHYESMSPPLANERSGTISYDTTGHVRNSAEAYNAAYNEEVEKNETKQAATSYHEEDEWHNTELADKGLQQITEEEDARESLEHFESVLSGVDPGLDNESRRSVEDVRVELESADLNGDRPDSPLEPPSPSHLYSQLDSPEQSLEATSSITPDPDPDYNELRSILVDSSVPPVVDGDESIRRKSVVTFIDKPEVITVDDAKKEVVPPLEEAIRNEEDLL